MNSSYHIGFANAQVFPWIVGKYGLSSLDLRSRVFWGGFGIEIVLTCYYREQEIVYIQDNFHHPFAPRRQGLIRDTEHTEKDVLMENREVPILHELPNLFETEASFCLSGTSPTDKKALSP
jgi:hypothetical protein